MFLENSPEKSPSVLIVFSFLLPDTYASHQRPHVSEAFVPTSYRLTDTLQAVNGSCAMAVGPSGAEGAARRTRESIWVIGMDWKMQKIQKVGSRNDGWE